MTETTSYAIHKIGANRGAPRIWLQGRIAETAGFTPNTRFKILVEKLKTRIVLHLDPEGDRKVSLKVKNDKHIPIIDINSAELLSIFEGLERVRVWAANGGICIEPLATDARIQQRLQRLRHKLDNGIPLAVGSISHGGGILDKAVHDGLAVGGVSSRLAFANDIREDLLVHAAEHNPCWDKKTIMLSAPMQELAFDHYFMSKLPQCDVVTAGIPCNGASVAGRAKNGTSCAEEHSEVGHLCVAFLAIIARVNPSYILIENVRPYQSSASMWILRHQLRDLGYVVHETVVDSKDWNSIESRKRMCLVATTIGMEFSMDSIAKPQRVETRLGDILEDIALDDPRWSEMQYLKDKEVRDKRDGKGFAMHIATPESTHVTTLGASYAKVRSTETKVAHPTNPRLLRQLTAKEHARCKSIDVRLIDGLSNTVAHEVLGQSVIPLPFVSIAETIAHSLKAFCGHAMNIARTTTNSAQAAISTVKTFVPSQLEKMPVTPMVATAIQGALF